MASSASSSAASNVSSSAASNASSSAASSTSSSAAPSKKISKNLSKSSSVFTSESDELPSVDLKTNLNDTKSQNDSVSFSYSFDTTNERVIHKGDTVKLNVPSEGLDYSTLQLSDGSNYFSLSYSAEDNVITLTATKDILYEGSVGATIVGNPTKNDSNTNKTGTYSFSSSYISSLGSTEEIPGDYMTLSVYNGTGFTASFGPHIVGVKDANYATSVGYNNNYSGASNGNAMYVYNQNAMIVAGYLWNYKGTYSNVVWKVRTSGYQIDQQSLRTYLGSKDETNSVTVTWDSDGEGFSIQLPGNYSPWGDQWSLRYVVKTNSNSDVVKGETSVTGIDNSTNSVMVEDPSNNISLNSSTTFEYYPTSNGKFAPYIYSSDKTIYSSQKLSNDDLLQLVKATDQVDGDISNKAVISNYGGFKVGENNTSGSYTITYSVTNSSGNTSTTTSAINVVNDQTSINTKDSTLVAGPNTTWSAADNFVSATDADGKALSLSDLKVSGSVDPTKAGSYDVTYSYTDAAGNAVTKTATITVIVKSDPVKPDKPISPVKPNKPGQPVNPVKPNKPSQPAKPVSPVTRDQTNQSNKSDKTAKSDYPTISSQVTSAKSGRTSQKSTTYNELPQTDESVKNIVSLGGLLLLVMSSLGAFLVGKKRRNQH
ncbi:cell surface protein precursor [Levilactobacillus brevis]|nr:cell surface protein precursor [Levilactobacillus brevis]